MEFWDGLLAICEEPALEAPQAARPPVNVDEGGTGGRADEPARTVANAKLDVASPLI